MGTSTPGASPSSSSRPLLPCGQGRAAPSPPRLVVPRRARVLVVSPHPDDGVLGAGGLMTHVAASRGSVEVVELTSGDAFSQGIAAVRPAQRPTPDSYRWYGSLREREVRAAMRELGIARSRIRLLGFPDDGLCQLAADRTPGGVFASPYTGRNSPPAAERLVPDAKYSGGDVRRELAGVMLAFRPTIVVLPDPRDEHPDHCAAHVLVHDAMAMATAAGLPPPRPWHYLIHFRQGPAAAADDAAGGRRVLALTAADRARKRRAIDAYRSQLAVMPEFLRAFDRPLEAFAETERDAAPAACWCRGENINRRP